MRAPPQIPSVPIEEVIERVRQRFLATSRPQVNPFGLRIVGTTINWRDGLSGESGFIATLSSDTFTATIAAVLDELAKLRASAPLKRKSVSSATTTNKTKTARRRAS